MLCLNNHYNSNILSNLEREQNNSEKVISINKGKKKLLSLVKMF